MSAGTIIGGVVGGVIGFVVGGPYGAFVGASIGMAIGSMIDPITPDIAAPGKPDVGELSINTAKEGDLLPDILGTVKMGGNIVWHQGKPRVVEVKGQSESGGGGKGGGGGSQEYTKGYKYYMTWVLEFCMGPIDTLYTIMENDDVIWSNEGLDCPGSGGMETITLGSEKVVDFYFGTDDQTPNSHLANMGGGPVWNIPRRHRCHMVFKDYYIGDYPRCPNLQIVAKKTPQIGGMTDTWREIFGYDYNPMFAKHYIIEEMAGVEASGLVDYTTWNADAETLFYEGRGISIYFRQQRSVREWLEQIDQHIFGGFRLGVDGEFESKLLRGTESVGSMPSLTPEEDCVSAPQFTRQSWLNVTNELKVQHPLRLFEDLPCNCDGVIGYTTLEMQVNEQQTLTVAGESLVICDYSEYTWEIITGSGTLSPASGQSIVYTAPATNSNCTNNPTIALKCGWFTTVDTITIAVNEVTANTIAYWTSTGCGYEDSASCDADPCPPTRWCCRYYKWDCSGTATGDGEPGAGRSCIWRYGDNASCMSAYQCRSIGPHDVRTEQQKLDGCCPGSLY